MSPSQTHTHFHLGRCWNARLRRLFLSSAVGPSYRNQVVLERYKEAQKRRGVCDGDPREETSTSDASKVPGTLETVDWNSNRELRREIMTEVLRAAAGLMYVFH